jgi:Cu-Zn family superoxide dismutase
MDQEIQDPMKGSHSGHDHAAMMASQNEITGAAQNQMTQVQDEIDQIGEDVEQEINRDTAQAEALMENAAGQIKSVIAMAALRATDPEVSLFGDVILTQMTDGLLVVANITNAPPGKHGFHIHENGSCEDGGNAAGGHFNPDGTAHGYWPEHGGGHAHPGDMGNILIGEDGTGVFEIRMPGLTFEEGKYAVAGKAIILHADEDDLGQPTGNAGGRIGCGIIQIVGQ